MLLLGSESHIDTNYSTMDERDLVYFGEYRQAELLDGRMFRTFV